MTDTPAPADLDWKPARSGGATFGTHRIVLTGERLELHPATGSKVLVGVIASAGLLTMAGGTFYWQWKDDPGALVVGVMMLVTSLVLVILLSKLLFNHRVFDRGLGLYWDTRRPQPTPLASIRGVQIVAEKIQAGDSRYISEELNLVLDDGQRITVIDHANRVQLRHDAEQVAQWLGVPLWVAAAVTDSASPSQVSALH